MSIYASRIISNQASEGGGLYSIGGPVRIYDSVISDNVANGTYPGGGGGIAIITIYEDGEDCGLELINTTISGNSTSNGAGGGVLLNVYQGGFGEWSIINSTITDNSAITGGGIYLHDELGDHPNFLEVHNTIIVDNQSTVLDMFDDIGNDNGEVLKSTSSYNLLRSGQLHGLTGANGNILLGTTAEAGLADLAFSGGTTRTHALASNSPAVNAGDPSFNPAAFTPPLDYDQRGTGFSRKFGGRIDIGAYELHDGLAISGPTEIDDDIEGNWTFTGIGGLSGVNGTVDIDWGDGTTPSLDVPLVNGVATVPHTYNVGLMTYTISATASDAGGEAIAPVTYEVNVTSAPYRFVETGGTSLGEGTATEGSTNIILAEGNSFSASLLESVIIKPSNNPNQQTLIVSFDDLSFPTAANDTINDAFEIALLDAAGNSLVPTIGVGRDSLFNITEDASGQSPLFAPGVSYVAAEGKVIIDVSDLPAQTSATIVYRLVNDDGDTNSSVTINKGRPYLWLWGTDNDDAQLVRVLQHDDAVDPSNREVLGEIQYHENNDNSHDLVRIFTDDEAKIESFAIAPDGTAYFVATYADLEEVRLFSLDLEDLPGNATGPIATLIGRIDGFSSGSHITGLGLHPITGELYALAELDAGNGVDQLWVLNTTVTNGGTGSGEVLHQVVGSLSMGGVSVTNAEGMVFVPSDAGGGNVAVKLYINHDTMSPNGPDRIYRVEFNSTTGAISNVAIEDNNVQGGLTTAPNGTGTPISSNGAFQSEGLAWDAALGRLVAFEENNHIFYLITLDGASGNNTTLSAYDDNQQPDINDIEGMAFVPLPVNPPGNIEPDPVFNPAGPISTTQLTDVTEHFSVDYGTTSFNDTDRLLHADVTATLLQELPRIGPLLLGVRNISDPNVSLYESAGTTPDGTSYYDITDLVSQSGGCTYQVILPDSRCDL